MLIPIPFADADDLAARWRTLTTDEKALAATRLSDASYKIIAECRSARYVDDADTDEQEVRAETLKIIACDMVKRAMIDTTDGPSVIETQLSAGPFGQRDKFANPTGDLFLTKAERRSLPCGRQSAFTVPMAYDVDVDEDDLS